ncbi:hypothetical protein ACVDFE_24900 [Lentzea chajnantorensis]
MTSLLRVSVVAPEHSAWGRTELKLLVDDRDPVEPVFSEGPREDPDVLLGPTSPLLPGDEPREVMIAEADCTWGCCGAVFVRVRREGGEVVWDGWRNPDDNGLSLPEVRFDLAQYEAELARADRDRFWEWPGREVARLVRDGLREHPAVLDRWDSGVDWAQSFPGTRDQVDVTFTSPPRHVVDKHWRTTRESLEHKQFVLRFPVTEEPVERQAEHIIATLRDSDPRASAEVCGGYTAPK